MLALNLNPDRYAGKTIMIIGAGYIQEPAVRIAKKLGLRVLAVDQDPQAPGLRWADLPLLISTSELAACTEAGRQQQINGVMSMGSEQGARTAAAVAHNLGLPGIPVEVAESFTNKVSIRRIMQEQQIPSPRFFICRTKLEAHKALLQLGLPLIVKPPDCHSSFGVTKVEKPEDFEWALERAAAFSHGETWVIEEYIQAVAGGGAER